MDIFPATPCPYFYPRSPCGERHCVGPANLLSKRNFYPRSPCGERRCSTRSSSAGALFLSTLSLRRATALRCLRLSISSYFYPRSPCGERQCRPSMPKPLIQFLSTLSLRRATRHGAYTPAPPGISIHALLAESDSIALARYSRGCHFYPRSPCGERPSAPCAAPCAQ